MLFAQPAERLARMLLGALLVRSVEGVLLAAEIRETEAYLGPRDLASHTRGGLRTARNASMWRGGGLAYVYFVYGMHHCFNVVAGAEGSGAAVLIRAVRPLLGIEMMCRNRGLDVPASMAATVGAASGRHPRIADGPARLTQAMAIDRRLDGEDLRTSDRVWIAPGAPREADIVETERIGVAYSGAWAKAPLRFVLDP